MKKIGVDVGGTTVKGALFDDDNLIREKVVPTNGSGGREAIFASLFSVLDEIFEDGVPIGVSSAGEVDPDSGVCVHATDILAGWSGVNIVKAVSERYGVRCKADNDAVCALKGELKYYPGLKDITMLTFGTGVGGACLVNGGIMRGKNFGAARWGHIPLVAGGRVCTCGKRGCAEAYLSATGLMRSMGRTLSGMGCEELFLRYEQGQKSAAAVLEEFATGINRLLSVVRTVMAPELILLGGGIMGSYQDIEGMIEDKSDVAPVHHGGMSGVYGALTLI